MTSQAQPQRIQRKRTKGWRMPPNTVYVGRPTVWGNPFRRKWDSPARCVFLYRDWCFGFLAPVHWPEGHRALVTFQLDYENMTPADAARTYLRGKNLACWCPLGQPCHADVLLKIANQ